MIEIVLDKEIIEYLYLKCMIKRQRSSTVPKTTPLKRPLED